MQNDLYLIKDSFRHRFYQPNSFIQPVCQLTRDTVVILIAIQWTHTAKSLGRIGIAFKTSVKKP